MKTENRGSIYFAHPMSTYGRPIERICVKALEDAGFSVDNPNCNRHQKGYQKSKSMEYFAGLVDSNDAFAFLPFRKDDALGAGVAYEMLAAMVRGKPIFIVEPMKSNGRVAVVTPVCKGGCIKLFSSIGDTDRYFGILSIQETRDRIKRKVI